VNARLDAEGQVAVQQQRADEACCNTHEAFDDDIVSIASTFARDRATLLRENCATILAVVEDFAADFRFPMNPKPGSL
jgi:hypothetical protein